MQTKIKERMPCKDKRQNAVCLHCTPALNRVKVVNSKDKGKKNLLYR